MRSLSLRGISEPTAIILGMTFKENVPDIRNSKVAGLAEALKRFGIAVQIHDSLASFEDAQKSTVLG